MKLPPIKQLPVTVGFGLVSSDESDERHVRLTFKAQRKTVATVEMSVTDWAEALMGVADKAGLMELRDLFAELDGEIPDWVKRKAGGA